MSADRTFLSIFDRLRRKLSLFTICLIAILAQRAQGQSTFYWDINGATANSGGAAPSGVWDTTTANWSTSSAGSVATTTWADIALGNNARFSAGTDATGTYTVTIPTGETRNISQILMNNNGANLTITGGAISLRTAVSSSFANILFQQAAGTIATLRIDSQLTGSVGLKVARNAVDNNILILSNPNNNFTGQVIVRNSNILRWAGNDVIPDTAVLNNEIAGGNFAPTFDLAGNSDTVKSIIHSGDAVSATRGPSAKITLGNGTLTLANPTTGDFYMGVISGSGGSFVKQGTGSFELRGANTYSGNTAVQNGTLILANANPINNSANIILGNGVTTGTLDVTGVTGGFKVGTAQSLKGNGNITGGTTINGTLSPGASIGSLFFSGALTLSGTANTVMEIDRNGTPNADLISALTVALGGTLTISDIGGGGFLANDSFNLLDGTLSGNFSSIAGLPTLDAGLAWDTSGLLAGGDGMLRVVPEPSTFALAGLGVAALLAVRRWRK